MSTTISHGPKTAVPERPSWATRLLVHEMWAALAIIVIWLTVLFDALFGPDIVNRDAGGNFSTVPSAVALALFATLATWVVAKYGFGRQGRDAD